MVTIILSATLCKMTEKIPLVFLCVRLAKKIILKKLNSEHHYLVVCVVIVCHHQVVMFVVIVSHECHYLVVENKLLVYIATL